MKMQTRFRTFETNSSSIYSYQISNELMGNSNLIVNKGGYVHVDLDEYYGREYKEYKTQEEKLKYICTWMYIYYGCNLKELRSGYLWIDFVNAFCEYVNEHSNPQERTYKCRGIKINEIKPKYDYDGAGGFLDHQSCPYGSYDTEGFILDIGDTNMLVNFIFNPYAWLQTDSD